MLLRDPLVATLIILAIGGFLTHFKLRRHPLGRAVMRVVFLVMLSIVLLHAGVVPWQQLTLTGVPLQDAVHALLKIAWWLWAAWFLVAFMRVFVVIEHRPREGKLIQDLLAGLVYLAAIFAIISYVFNLPISGLLATSGVIAIVLGLALQSTLGDLFSGIVLDFSRPYRPGDWISIDGTTDGRVIEIIWRATHVLTAKRDLAIVPNSTIAKAKVVNSSSPSDVHGMMVTVRLDAKTPPATATPSLTGHRFCAVEVGTEILQYAVLNTRLILATPAPLVSVKAISADAVEFEISFFVEQLAQSIRAQNELLAQISRHLAATGISLTSSQNQPYAPPQAAAPESAKTAAERAIDLVAIFDSLNAEERKALAAKTKQRPYDFGDILVKPGEAFHSLFIIGAGVVSVTKVHSEGEIELVRMGPGDHFGDIGLVAENPMDVTLRALAPIMTYELTKEDLVPVIGTRPEVSQRLCSEFARRQAAGELLAAPQIDKDLPPPRVAAWFSERLHRLFDLTHADKDETWRANQPAASAQQIAERLQNAVLFNSVSRT
jgi:small-conductance mechanosensitive channel/CRP-like cAMP-binding protein